ncbi:DUF4870 domain-containing protein [Lederbergia sp. NSJ-179]|uniref:DUF4870 domain-containing protein n=1 Tax=Lederbergia sp. NSJ-179 TaxID=2931402 RepID=UPI001FD57F5D|nr:DUF4870 domain-containing protein [Lederbergia sp. NSJ-179]MCJ7842250.1 DUF4870 domain-containing protein [Lederbergia sp. NSJ-179]
MSQEDPVNSNEEESNSGNQNEENHSSNEDNIVTDEEIHENAKETKESMEEHADSQGETKNNLVANNGSSHQSNSDHPKTSTGLDENIAALISYIGGFVTGIIFFFLEKDNKFIRFHALQSAILTAAWLIIKFVLGHIPFIGWLLVFLVNGLTLAIWIVCMVKAYQKQSFKLPVIGDLADQYK